MSYLVYPVCGFLLLFSSFSIQAQVHLCIGADGHHRYQQLACAADEAAAFDPPLLNALGDPLRRGEQELLRSYQRRDAARRRADTNRRKQAGKTAAALERRQDGCWKKSQQLDQVNARLRRGYKAAQGIRLRDRRRGLEAYLGRFCR